jgi:YHS domain-containing protein
MREMNKPRSPTTGRDPVGGMEIEPAQAFAARTSGEETFSFCSERCVQQFDREHAGSATTGISDGGKLRRIELAVADLDGRRTASYLQEQLKALPGVRQVTASAWAKLPLKRRCNTPQVCRKRRSIWRRNRPISTIYPAWLIARVWCTRLRKRVTRREKC